jgi:DNA-binding transcriptional ArsR family regulator
MKMESLPQQKREALNHPVRRQILRTLNRSESPLSPGEIASTGLPDSSLSVVSYHARVLRTCGSVSLSTSDPSADERAPLYVSNVADDEQVATVLEATRDLDKT